MMELVRGRASLAPMAGVTDRAYRAICRDCGCPFAVTEMVSAKGFLRAGHQRAVQELLRLAPGEKAAVQIFGHDPGEMGEAAAVLSAMGFIGVDINMGCPAPKITGGGDGSALLLAPALAEKIVAAVAKATPLPVTVKMRVGWDACTEAHVDFAKGIAGAGARLLTVHGRTRKQQYAGRADWEAIARVVRAVDVPVLGNGDVRSPGDFAAMMEQTGCYGVMIGRGALGNPWIFDQINAHQRGESMPPPSRGERIAMLLRHARALCGEKPERIALREMRKHAAWYLHGLRDAAAMRNRVQQVESYGELAALMEEYQRMEEGI